MRVLRRERRNERRPTNGVAVLALAFVATGFASISFAQSPQSNTAAPAAATMQPAQPAAPAAGSAAAGQGPTGSFAGLSKNSNQPIDIESDVLLVHDSQKTATFKGNVKAVQGTTILYSKELEVHYAGGGSESLTGAPGAKPSTVASTDPATATPEAAKPPAAGDKSGMALGDNGTKITRIYARGDVVINSDQDQTTTGDLADYDVPGQMVTVSGNVVLTQGKNVLKGDRLVIDLTTGESRFDNTGNTAAGGRIRALFMPKKDGAGDAKPGDAKSGGAESGDAKSGGATAKHEAETGSQPDTDASDKAEKDDSWNAQDPFIPEMRP